jgi:hypothetical protein
MAPGINVDPLGRIPTSSKVSDTELDRAVARIPATVAANVNNIGDELNTLKKDYGKGINAMGAAISTKANDITGIIKEVGDYFSNRNLAEEQNIANIKDRGFGIPASTDNKSLVNQAADVGTSMGIIGNQGINALHTAWKDLTGYGMPALDKINQNAQEAEAFRRSQLGRGVAPFTSAATPNSIPKASTSQQAPAGITPPATAPPANETIAKPAAADTSAATPAVGGIKPYVPPTGWSTKIGEQDFTKAPYSPTEFRRGITRDSTDNKIIYDPQTNQPVPLIEARGIDSLKKPVDETAKTLGIIDKELARPGTDKQALLKTRSDVVGHGIIAKDRNELTRLQLENKQENTELNRQNRADILKLNELKDWETRYSDVDPLTQKATFSGTTAVAKSLLEGLEVPSRYKPVETKVLETIKSQEDAYDKSSVMQKYLKDKGMTNKDPRYIAERRKRLLANIINPPTPK